MAVSLAGFIYKFSKGLLLIIVNNNLGGNSIPFKNLRQILMSILLQPHRMYAQPTILSAVGLGILILTIGHNTSRHCVSKNRVGKTLISHHPVICQETTCQGRMQTCSDVPLDCLLDSSQGLSLVNIPPLFQGLRIDLFAFCGLEIAKARRRVKAGKVVSVQDFDMRDIDI